MKRFLLLIFSVFTIALAAQPSITVLSTTPSRCFNDGTIQVSGNGGTPPYTFSIVSGPAYPSVTYPITLVTGISLFQAVPSGTFTVQIKDASGATSSTSATVGGNYQFPLVNYSVTGSCIIAQGTQGVPPYQYAISAVSQSTGFGPFQSSPNFCGICGGDRWLRVKDSCGNIYTSLKITVSIGPPSLNLDCHKNLSNGKDSIVAVASGGVPPYSYTFTNGISHFSNTTGNFGFPRSCNKDTITVTDGCSQVTRSIDGCNDFGLSVISKCSFANIGFFFYGGVAPYTVTGMGYHLSTHNQVLFIDSLPGGVYTFTIQDSCGRTFNYQAQCDNNGSYGVGAGNPSISIGSGSGPGNNNPCKFDSTISLSSLTAEWKFPLTITCVTCIPQQSVVVTAATPLPAKLFFHIPPNVSQAIHYTNAFGVDYWDSIKLVPPIVHAGTMALSCNDYQATTTPPNVPYIHWDLYNSSNVLLQHDTIGYFANLANGTYTVVMHPDSGGCPNDTTQISLPVPVGFCYVPTHNSSCNLVYDIFQGGIKYKEHWSLHSSSGSVYPEYPDSSLILYNDIPPGNYTYVSDSGCSSSLVLPPISPQKLTVTTKVSCQGQSLLIASTSNPGSCTSNFGFRYDVVKNGVIIASNNSGVFQMTDTGWILVRLYYKTISNFGVLPTTFDSVCVLDSAYAFVTNSTIPYLKATEVKVCGQNAANIPFQIFGGSVPYTLEIQGKPPVILNSNNGLFPNLIPGIYTLIVYDSCGISRSYSVSILDTCATSCGTHAAFNLSPSPACKESKVTFSNTSTNASNFIWFVNGLNYGTNRDTTFTFSQSGTNVIKLKAFFQNCVDSMQLTILIEDSIRFNLGPDTFLCGGFSKLLTTPYATTHWSTGAIGTQINVTNAAGIYWAEVSNSCNTLRDSVWLTSRYFPPFDIGNDTILCDLASLQLHAAVDSATFLWSNGVTDSVIVVTQQPVNPIVVTVSRKGCVVADSIHVNYEQTPLPFTLGADSFFCTSRYLELHAPVSAHWSTGAVAGSIRVVAPGVYWAEVSNFCGSFRDSVVIHEETLPDGFSVSSDRDEICVFAGDSAIVTASVSSSNSSVIFIWPSFTDTGLTASHVFHHPDTFVVTAYNGKCDVSEVVRLKMKYCGEECFEKYVLPNALTANGDHINDTFNIISLCDMDPFLMRIYDRWGELVFETHDVHQGWDGTLKRKQQEQEVLFYYICFGVAGVPNQKCFTGPVTILK